MRPTAPKKKIQNRSFGKGRRKIVSDFGTLMEKKRLNQDLWIHLPYHIWGQISLHMISELCKQGLICTGDAKDLEKMLHIQFHNGKPVK